MASRPSSPLPQKPIKEALDPIVTAGPATAAIANVGHALLAPFTGHRGGDSTKILSDLAPQIMTPKRVRHVSTSLNRRGAAVAPPPSAITRYDFATLGRAPLALTARGRRVTSRDLEINESMPELLDAPIPEPEGLAQTVSLLQGFNATIPGSERGKARRRKMRNVEFDEPDELGLKRLGLEARGLLTNESETGSGKGSNRGKLKPKKRTRESLASSKVLGKDELNRQKREILQDKENLHVRRKLIQADIAEVTHKIHSLEHLRAKLEQDLLRIQEENLELDDELEGIQERGAFEEAKGSEAGPSSRRRKGPAFLPSEHDELPNGVAFMTLDSHTAPINALDFTEPYGLLVTASQDDSTRLWDLSSGEEIGFLRGHTGAVRCLQVEGNTCVTGGLDSTVRIWDLRMVEEEEEALNPSAFGSPFSQTTLPSIPDDDRDGSESGVLVESHHQIQASHSNSVRGCQRTYEGHTKAVTALYFEDNCLVSGASDKTLRQWDLNTGQCVMTMDILWAISHPPSVSSSSRRATTGGFGFGLSRSNSSSGDGLPGASVLTAASSGPFSFPSPPNAEGSWDMYQDFVGGLQFWGYALVSGSGDGAVRMWDMRTGQAHRTLVGHTAPVTCLQFDELHIVSGSLDKTVRIWDLRTGGISETLRYDYPVTALQFDSRKVVSCTGENGIKIYNRTTMQHQTLVTNGHTKPVERLRFMDRYMVSGARDATVKIWAL